MAKGFVQREGVYYGEVYAAVREPITLRTLLAFAAARDLEEIHQLDIDSLLKRGRYTSSSKQAVTIQEGYFDIQLL